MVLVQDERRTGAGSILRENLRKGGRKDPEGNFPFGGPCLELVRSPGMMMSGQGKSKHYIFCSGHPDEAKLHNYYFIKTSD